MPRPRPRPRSTVLLVLALAMTPLLAETPPRLTAPDAYPTAARVDTVDVHHGVRVADPYRAFEDLDAPATRAFARAQDDLARELLDDAPPFEGLRKRLLEIVRFDRWIRAEPRGDRVFLVRASGSGTTDVSYHLLNASLERDANPRSLLDASRLPRSANGPTNDRVLSSLVSPSPDGRHLAHGSRLPGSRWHHVHVLDVAAGTHLPERLVGIHTTRPYLSWTADGAGFFYTAHPEPAPGAEQTTEADDAELRYHRLGTPQAEDRVILSAGDDTPDRSFSAFVSDDGRIVAIHVTRDAWRGSQVWRLDLPDGVVPADGEALTPRALVADTESTWGWLGARGDELLYWTDRDAPTWRIVALGANGAVRDVVAAGERTLSSASRAAGHLFLTANDDAVPTVAVHRLDGRFVRTLEMPFLGVSWSGFLGRDDAPHAYFGLSSLADPGTQLRVDPRRGSVEIVLEPSLAYDPRDFVVRRVLYPSADDTRVPIFLAHRRDLEPSAATPVWLYAYGAWGWSAFPWFQAQIVVWMERGGVYALAGVRGGGEYGAEWHEAGRGARRQTAVDDFVAAARWLRARGVGTRAGIVANGGSASGPLVGVAVTQAPEVWGAAIVDIPALDLVRFDQLLGGARWRPEFGRVETAEDFRVLHRLSPYHRVERDAAGTDVASSDGTGAEASCLPPVLVSAGEKDESTVPSHAYKFTAALQRAQARAGCTEPALLQVAWGAGHGPGTTVEQSAETWARQLAFLERVLPGSPEPSTAAKPTCSSSTHALCR